MTRNAIPILVDEGVQAITIGVNGGSAPPGVPKNVPFIWRDKPSGKEIITAVHPGRLTAGFLNQALSLLPKAERRPSAAPLCGKKSMLTHSSCALTRAPAS